MKTLLKLAGLIGIAAAAANWGSTLVHAGLIHTVIKPYGASSFPNPISVFHFGYSESDAHFSSSWEVNVLTIDPFSDAVWGQSFTIHSGNNPHFADFAAQLTDGEEDWLGYYMINSLSGGAGWVPNEPYFFFSDSSGLSGIDLNGYRIDQIELLFEEYHWPEVYQVQGQLTIKFIGEPLASVPEAGTTASLLGFSLFCLATCARQVKSLRK